MANERVRNSTETFIVPGGEFGAVKATQQAERTINGAKGQLNFVVQNNGLGQIMMELRQGTKSLSGSVVNEDIGNAAAPLNITPTLTSGQCVPGTLVITTPDDGDSWTDDGNGILVPDAGNASTFVSGTINYLTGAITLSTTGGVATGDVLASHDKGYVYNGNTKVNTAVAGYTPREKINVYGYSNLADATYLSVLVNGDIGGA